MSTMDVKELRQLSSDELAEKAKQLAQELFNLRFQMATGRLDLFSAPGFIGVQR